MKKLLPLIILSLFITLHACDSNYYAESYKEDCSIKANEAYSVKTIETSNNWKDLLSHITTTNAIKNIDNLQLTDYNYITTVNSSNIESIKSNIFSNSSLLPISDTSTNNYKLETIEYIEQDTANAYILPPLKAYVDSILHKDVSIVELIWNYENKIINSTCIISNKNHEAIYDNILFNLIYSEPMFTGKKLKRLKNNRESDVSPEEGTPEGNALTYIYTQGETFRNMFGHIVGWATITCKMAGRTINNKKSLEAYEISTDKYASYGKKSVAEAKCLSFERGINGHLQLACGWGHGGNSLKLTLLDFGYELSGQEYGSTREAYLIPEMLN